MRLRKIGKRCRMRSGSGPTWSGRSRAASPDEGVSPFSCRPEIERRARNMRGRERYKDPVSSSQPDPFLFSFSTTYW